MAEKRPLCHYGGRIQELASGDTLPGGGGGLSIPAERGTLYLPGRVTPRNLDTQPTTAGYLYAYPFWVPRAIPGIDRLGCAVATAASGATLNLGLYTDAGVAGDLKPGTRLGQVTGLDGGTTGNKYGTLASPIDLAAGTVYWVATLPLTAGPTLRALNVEALMPLLGAADGTTTIIQWLCRRITGQSSLPADLSGTDLALQVTANPPLVVLEVIP